MFEPLPAQFNFPQAEEQVLEFWEKHKIFARSLEQRRGAPRFVFYEGPPTANGLPHPGHCLTRAMKDLFPRYQTMCGKLVERKAGWDTHGLPVEVEVCKELGIHTKEEIEAYGVEKFVRKCIESVFRYTREWEQMTRRLGFWVNLEEAYVTFHQSYVESVWWSLKTLFDRGLLYQGHKVVWWWAQGGTALSAGEVGEGYRTVQDPSVYVRFPLVSEPEAQARDQGTERRHAGTERGTEGRRDEGTKGATAVPADVASAPRGRRSPHEDLPPGSKVSLLVWTTTPWTLISNHFAAVGPDMDYSLVHDETTDEYFYIATALVGATAEKVKHKLVEVGTCKGASLLGLRYEPPIREAYYDRVPWGEYGAAGSTWQEATPQRRRMGDVTAQLVSQGGEDHIAWRVVRADFVDLETGTGIVHIAPAYGEVDFNLLQEERQRFAVLDDVPLINAVKPDGTFSDEAPQQYRGRWVKDCDKEIMRELKDRGILYHQETIEHEYPFCPRAEDDPLIQYARKSWFVRTSQFKEEFLKNNAAIQWLPEHIKEGRFGDFLRNNVDWALSRERWWGTPLPIWVCEKTGKMEAIGSYAELLAKPGVQGVEVWEAAKKADPALPDHLKVHKPYIDEVTYESPFDGEGIEGSRDQGIKGATAVSAVRKKARMRRVPEVIDCWWDAGSMPFAQWGFPHVKESVRTFVERFPADFISEAIDQTRGWFYGLLAISTLLFSKGSAGVSPAQTGTGVASEPVTDALQKRRRRRIPHWEAGGSTYFVTFSTVTTSTPDRREALSAEERDIVLAACRHWDGQRVLLHAAAVMPDHVHLLFTPLEQSPGQWWPLADLLHSIKSFTAKEIGRLRGREGRVWQPEYFDRIIRTESDFNEKWTYVVTNAERAGLGDQYRWIWVEPDHAEQSGRDARAPQTTAATLPDYPHPYRTCIVLGHVMGEDGLKMSKRTKNYKEPAYIFDTYGADAMRWYFFSAQAPWTSVRFQEANIRDAQREFLVRLYNVFSFFNIYANIDGFQPGIRDQGIKKSRDQGTSWRPVSERAEIDRWITSELHRTILDVRAAMDRFENYPAAGRLNEFVDALSNWYVRRSRDRFWRGIEGSRDQGIKGGAISATNQDKWDAYNTLYEVLLTLSKLIAPFTPFFAETMYQNLAGGQVLRNQGNKGSRDQGGGAGAGGSDLDPSIPRSLDPLSVHLCEYPAADNELIDDALGQEMDLVREIVSLGRAARTAAKLKVRQPLALAEIILVRREHTEWLASHNALIAEELNIKQVEFSTEAEQYVTYALKPDFKAIGPKFGKLAPQVAAALGKLDAAAARKELETTGRLVVTVNGEPVVLTDQEVAVRLEARPGWSATQGRGGVVVVKTELTDELRDEGLCRELIHQVQALRKDQNLPYEARVTLYIQGPDKLRGVVQRFADTIKAECLAQNIELTAAPPDIQLQASKIEAHEVRLGIRRV